MGERLFIIRAFFEQEADGVLGWLAREATIWVKLHRQHLDALGKVAEAWEDKAEATVTLLEELKQATVEVT